MDQRITFRDCYLEQSGDTLAAGSAALRRTWKITGAGLIPQTLENARTGENLVHPEEESLSPADLPQGEAAGKLSLSGGKDDDYGFALPHLRAALTIDYEKFSVRYEFNIYPELPILRTRMFLRGCTEAPLRTVVRLDFLSFAEKHCEWESISLRAVTDSHNNLVRKSGGLFYCNEAGKVPGNLLRIHRTIQNDGVILIREAPALEEQVRWIGSDFIVFHSRVAAVAAGLDPLEDGEEWVPLYGSAVVLYEGGDLAFAKALHTYWEARHRFRPGFDGAVFSNTWGDDTGGRNIREDFLEKDISAAAEMGVSQYQIDAGWDTGAQDKKTGRSYWTINRAAFPEDFRPFDALAEKLGVTPGVWFVPYTEDGHHYGCYQQDAQELADLCLKHGMHTLKLDGFRLPDYTTTYRFEKMLQLVLEKTGSDVYFNIDITNWPRTGLFGATQYGNLFLENRYTNRINYYPHGILRNLWMIAPYFPICRIQAEFPNVALHSDLYEKDQPGDALSPERCGQIYALGCVLFASPLAWMQPCFVDADMRKRIRALLDSVKDARCGAVGSLELPVGEIPNGVHFTGFQALENENSGWLLLLRENAPENSFCYRLHGGAGEGYRFTEIASTCQSSVKPVQGPEINVMLAKPFSFAVYRYEKE